MTFSYRLVVRFEPHLRRPQRLQLLSIKRDHSQNFVGPQMEGMVNDLQLARDNQQAFEEWRQAQSNSASAACTPPPPPFIVTACNQVE